MRSFTANGTSMALPSERITMSRRPTDLGDVLETDDRGSPNALNPYCFEAPLDRRQQLAHGEVRAAKVYVTVVSAGLDPDDIGQARVHAVAGAERATHARLLLDGLARR